MGCNLPPPPNPYTCLPSMHPSEPCVLSSGGWVGFYCKNLPLAEKRFCLKNKFHSKSNLLSFSLCVSLLPSGGKKGPWVLSALRHSSSFLCSLGNSGLYQLNPCGTAWLRQAGRAIFKNSSWRTFLLDFSTQMPRGEANGILCGFSST